LLLEEFFCPGCWFCTLILPDFFSLGFVKKGGISLVLNLVLGFARVSSSASGWRTLAEEARKTVEAWSEFHTAQVFKTYSHGMLPHSMHCSFF